MRIMIFIDDENFRANFKCIEKQRNENRFIDYYKINDFVCDYLSNHKAYRNEKLSHLRTYVYTGAFVDSLFSKIKKSIEVIELTDKIKAESLKQLHSKNERRRDAQKKFLDISKTYHFFEVRTKPLQFSYDKGIFQKGVDVQIAVDLVSNAYLGNYDVAVLFSGDIDLLESLKIVKGLGKQIIVFSHHDNMAKEMIRESDMFIDLNTLDSTQLDLFSHIFQKKNNNTLN